MCHVCINSSSSTLDWSIAKTQGRCNVRHSKESQKWEAISPDTDGLSEMSRLHYSPLPAELALDYQSRAVCMTLFFYLNTKIYNVLRI